MSTLKLSIPILLLLFIISHFIDFSESQFFPSIVCDPHDVKVLLRIKRHLGNPPVLGSWDRSNGCDNPFEQWLGVEWDGQGRVTALSFSGDQIHVIPPFLDRLPSLSDLYFSHMPNLTEPFPPYFGKLDKLVRLYIGNVNISGPYPDSLVGLTSLIRLVITRTKLGAMPNFISHLTGLIDLDLTANKLTGSIPPGLGRLADLQFLSLSDNNLSGPIPTSLGRLDQLTFLSLRNNRLSGPVPAALGRANLSVVRLSNNKLEGDVSFLLDDRAIEVDISNNRFKFDLTNVDLAPELYNFNISHNMIYGRLPRLFYRLRYVLRLQVDITYNDLCGPIPNGRRLKHVNPKLFAHNKCLCGGPLPPCK